MALILHLIDDFHFTEATARLPDLLDELSDAAALHNSQVRHVVVAINNVGTQRARYEAVASEVLDLGHRPCDPTRPLTIWRTIKSLNPSVVHHWGYRHRWARQLVNWFSRGSKRIVSAIEQADLNSAVGAARFLRGRFDAVVTESQTLDSLARESSLARSGNLQFVPAAVRHEGAGESLSVKARREHPLRKKLLEQFGFSPDVRVVLVAGQLTYDKNFEDVLWSADQASCVTANFIYLVHGVGPAEAKLRKYAHLFTADRHTRFLGEEYELSTLAEFADVYLTADLEAGPNAGLLRAVVAGIPVIASDTPAHREHVSQDSNGLLVNHKMRAEFARAVLKFLEAPGLDEKLTTAAIARRATTLEHWNAYVQSYRTLY